MAVQTLTDVARDAEDDIDADPRISDNPEALTYVLAAIRDCRADLAALYAKVELMLLAAAGERRFLVDGLGEVEIRRSTKRTQWDSEALTRRLVAMARDERILDEKTGEYEPPEEAVARVLSECVRPSWRVTPLRARHIDETEYCTVEEGAYSVQLPPRAAR
jgi:hypothetical protein